MIKASDLLDFLPGSAAAPVLPLTVICSFNFVRRTVSNDNCQRWSMMHFVRHCAALLLFQSAILITLNTSSIQIHADMIYSGRRRIEGAVY